MRGYSVAMFKMGIAEDRLFEQQPALALGFRKSFQREHDNRASRVAELYLVGSKQLGAVTRLDVGGVFWTPRFVGSRIRPGAAASMNVA